MDLIRSHAGAIHRRARQLLRRQWWLVPGDRTDVPHDAYSTAGNRGQDVIVAPSLDVVIVHRGLDCGRQRFDRWDLTREVLKSIRTASDN